MNFNKNQPYYNRKFSKRKPEAPDDSTAVLLNLVNSSAQVDYLKVL